MLRALPDDETRSARSRSPQPRCSWVPAGDALYVAYHDQEWGVPCHDDRHLFEMLVLEGAQAGLSWATILRKREAYRRAFAGFDVEAVARFGRRDLERLLGNREIVRNRLKIESAVANARAALAVREEQGSLDAFFWGLVGDRPAQNRFRELSEIPAETPASDAMSKELRRRGFRFVGPTICYAFMQATGLVNDHVRSCFRHDEVAALA
jgi:DNA-3-methyladenine glycosylase I